MFRVKLVIFRVWGEFRKLDPQYISIILCIQLFIFYFLVSIKSFTELIIDLKLKNKMTNEMYYLEYVYYKQITRPNMFQTIT